MTLLVGVLVASLLGSMHCAAMCGGFVCFYAGGAEPGATPLRSHALYNTGRLATYITLGFVAGAVGASLDRAGALAGVSRAAAIVAGTILMVWGASTVLALNGIRLPVLPHSAQSRFGAPIARVIRALRDQPPAVRALGTGIVTTLIPCGWLYAFVATAAGTGGPLSGAAVMMVFWTGTLPVMVALGLGVQRLLDPMRRRLPALSAAVVMVLGLLSLTGHLRPPGAMRHQDAAMHAPR